MDYQYSDNYVKHRKASDRPRQSSMPEKASDVEMIPAEKTKKEYWKLAGIIFLIVICAAVMSTVVGFDWQEWMRWFMGGFFVFFGSFKLIGYESFHLMFPVYDPIARKYKWYGYSYPFIELFLGFLYCSDLFPLFRDVTTIVLLGIGAYGVRKAIKAQQGINCACLGNIIKLPLSSVTLLEDVLMVAMAAIMLVSSIVL